MKPALKTLVPIFALLAGIFLAGCPMNSDDTDDYTITAASAETITESDLEGTSWERSTTYTYINAETVELATIETIEFKSDGNVTWSYKNDRYSKSYSGVYTVDGSTVTIDYLHESTPMQLTLTYLSEQLVEVGVILTKEGSSGSGNTVSLPGTTWTCTDTGTSSVNGVVESTWTNTYTLKFQSNGNVILCVYQDSEPMGEFSYTYGVDGSMVTIYYEGGDVFTKLAYLSGQLVVVGSIYTKVS